MPRSPGKREAEGCQAPTAAHQPPPSSYQPASMTKYSAPASAAASMWGISAAVVGSPIRQFM